MTFLYTSYHSTLRYKDSEDCRYTHHCAQLESRRHNSKKNHGFFGGLSSSIKKSGTGTSQGCSDGYPDNRTPPHWTDLRGPCTSAPKIDIHLNGRLERAPHSESSGDSDEALQSYVDSLDDEEDLEEDPDAVDRWDGPASIFESGETAFATTAASCSAWHRIENHSDLEIL
jgi:hypothetical protein